MNTNKAELIVKLLKVWEQNPDLRLCQLLDNILYSNFMSSNHDNGIFYIEDEHLEKLLDEKLQPNIGYDMGGSYERG